MHGKIGRKIGDLWQITDFFADVGMHGEPSKSWIVSFIRSDKIHEQL